jgi:hypothetical protein
LPGGGDDVGNEVVLDEDEGVGVGSGNSDGQKWTCT